MTKWLIGIGIAVLLLGVGFTAYVVMRRKAGKTNEEISQEIKNLPGGVWDKLRDKLRKLGLSEQEVTQAIDEAVATA